MAPAAISGPAIPVEHIPRYNKLKRWEQVQKDIQNTLNLSTVPWSITVTSEPQVLECLDHRQDMQCLFTYKAASLGDVFVTQQKSGSSNQLLVWTVPITREVRLQRFSVKATIKKILMIPKHRMFAAYCTDMVIRLFADPSQNFALLMEYPCPSTITCFAYIREHDELLAGCLGCMRRWSLSQYRDGLIPLEPYKVPIEPEELVLRLRVEERSQILMVHCETCFYCLHYPTNSIVEKFANPHVGALSCFLFHNRSDMVITGGREGAIKLWSRMVYSLMHEFLGHSRDVTGMVVHETEPLLISTSLDGTLRMWRLDTFEPQQRIDLGDSVHGMDVINHSQIVYWTQKSIKILNLNMFHMMFNATQSMVRKILRSWVPGKNTRIVIALEDGSMSILSTVTGAILTIIYPLPTNKEFTDCVYEREGDMLYAILEGNVIVFDCTYNPCRPVYRLSPSLHGGSDIECVATLHLSYTQVALSAAIILAGHSDGQITLLHALSPLPELSPVKAHQGRVCRLQAMPRVHCGDSPWGHYDCLLSLGSDWSVKAWHVIAGKKRDNEIRLKMVAYIELGSSISHLALLGTSLCYTYDNERTTRMMKLGDVLHSRAEELTHHRDHDHTHRVTSLACCAALHVFATSADDWCIKLWDGQNQLVRELVFPGPVYSVNFANCRGDLLIGYTNHLHLVRVVNYLPPSALESLLEQQFVDDQAERPIEFDPFFSLRTAFDSICEFPIDCAQRLPLEVDYRNNRVQERVRLRDEIQQREKDRIKKEEAARQFEAKVLSAIKALDVRRNRCDASADAQLKLFQQRFLKKHPPSPLAGPPSPVSEESSVEPAEPDSDQDTSDLSDQDDLTDSDEADGDDMKLKQIAGKATVFKRARGKSSARSRSAQKKKKAQEKQLKEEETIKEEPEKVDEEEERRKREEAERIRKEEMRKRYPIAPDGYIPNSVVRHQMRYKPPPDKILKPLPEPFKPAEVIYTPPPITPPNADSTLEEIKAFLSDALSNKGTKPPHQTPDSSPSSPPPAPTPKLPKVIIFGGGGDRSVTDLTSTSREPSNDAVLRSPPGEYKLRNPNRLKTEDTFHTGTGTNNGTGPKMEGQKSDGSLLDDSLYDSSDIMTQVRRTSLGAAIEEEVQAPKPMDVPEPSPPSPQEAPPSPVPTIPTETTPAYQMQAKQITQPARPPVPPPHPRVKVEMPDLGWMKKKIGESEGPQEESAPAEAAEDDYEEAESASESDSDKEGAHPLLVEITTQSWYPKSSSGDQTIAGVVTAFTGIMDNVNNPVHKQICGYITSIHRELGYPEDQLMRVVDKLVIQLGDSDAVVRANATRTLGDLGCSQRHVLVGLIELLKDREETVRQEAMIALKKLAGISSKESLLQLMKQLGLLEEDQTGTVTPGQALPEFKADVYANIENWLMQNDDDDENDPFKSLPEVTVIPTAVKTEKDAKQRKKKGKGRKRGESSSLSDSDDHTSPLHNTSLPAFSDQAFQNFLTQRSQSVTFTEVQKEYQKYESTKRPRSWGYRGSRTSPSASRPKSVFSEPGRFDSQLRTPFDLQPFPDDLMPRPKSGAFERTRSEGDDSEDVDDIEDDDVKESVKLAEEHELKEDDQVKISPFEEQLDAGFDLFMPVATEKDEEEGINDVKGSPQEAVDDIRPEDVEESPQEEAEESPQEEAEESVKEEDATEIHITVEFKEVERSMEEEDEEEGNGGLVVMGVEDDIKEVQEEEEDDEAKPKVVTGNSSAIPAGTKLAAPTKEPVQYRLKQKPTPKSPAQPKSAASDEEPTSTTPTRGLNPANPNLYKMYNRREGKPLRRNRQPLDPTSSRNSDSTTPDVLTAQTHWHPLMGQVSGEMKAFTRGGLSSSPVTKEKAADYLQQMHERYIAMFRDGMNTQRNYGRYERRPKYQSGAKDVEPRFRNNSKRPAAAEEDYVQMQTSSAIMKLLKQLGDEEIDPAAIMNMDFFGDLAQGRGQQSAPLSSPDDDGYSPDYQQYHLPNYLTPRPNTVQGIVEKEQGAWRAESRRTKGSVTFEDEASNSVNAAQSLDEKFAEFGVVRRHTSSQKSVSSSTYGIHSAGTRSKLKMFDKLDSTRQKFRRKLSEAEQRFQLFQPQPVLPQINRQKSCDLEEKYDLDPPDLDMRLSDLDPRLIDSNVTVTAPSPYNKMYDNMAAIVNGQMPTKVPTNTPVTPGLNRLTPRQKSKTPREKQDGDTGIGTDTESYAVDHSSQQLSSRPDDDSGFDDNSARDKTLVTRGATSLSPVKSMAEIQSGDDPDTTDAQTDQPPENWRAFFDRPSAQERRRRAEQQEAPPPTSSRLPPINYMTDSTSMPHTDPGQRVLSTVVVSPHRDDSLCSSASSSTPSSRHRHRVVPLPAKLAVNAEAHGSSKYGILKMQWTTNIPPPVGSPTLSGDRPSARQFPQLNSSPHTAVADVTGADRSTSNSTDHFLPSLSATQPGTTEFDWERPMPPAPEPASPTHKKGHGHYCDYYRLLKKRMHDHCSVSAQLSSILKLPHLRVLTPSVYRPCQPHRGHRPRRHCPPTLPPMSTPSPALMAEYAEEDGEVRAVEDGEVSTIASTSYLNTVYSSGTADVLQQQQQKFPSSFLAVQESSSDNASPVIVQSIHSISPAVLLPEISLRNILCDT